MKRVQESNGFVVWLVVFFLIKLGTVARKYNGKTVAATVIFSDKARMSRP